MAENIKIYQNKDQNGNPVASLTPEAAVYDENGVRLSTKLKDLSIEKLKERQDQAIENITQKEEEAISNFSAQRVTPEMLSESTKQYIEASGGGTITNLADDEDLESVNDVLKFKDKAYQPDNFSGLGRKYLRKNIVEGKNVLTQDMINETNTIYIIQYDYDLNGEEIVIPENCTLQFEGGSLSNGKIKLSNYTDIDNEAKMYNVEIIDDEMFLQNYSNKDYYKFNKPSSDTYFIYKDMWMLNDGFPTPSETGARYTDDEYNRAKQNHLRIQAAVNYACRRGYRKVVIEKGNYAFCFLPISGYEYNDSAQVNIINIDFDCNGSAFKFILDSDNANPFGVSYNVRNKTCIMFALLGTSSIHDGECIGEMLERSFTNPDNDKKQEWSVGVSLYSCYTYNFDNSLRSKWCKIYNMNLHHFGGDAILLSSWDSSNHKYKFETKNATYTLGTLSNTGEIQESTTNVVSSRFDVSAINKDERAINTGNLMIFSSEYYKRLGNTNVAGCYFGFYDADGNFLGKSDWVDYYEYIMFPKDCHEFVIELENQTDYTNVEIASKSQMVIGWDENRAGYNLVKNCIISYNHRGGIFLGGHYNTIRGCRFLSTGYSPFSQGSGTDNVIFDYKKILPYIDNTNYCINMEDDPGMGSIIEDNVFMYGYNVLLLGGNGFIVRNNKFIHCMQSIATYWSKNIQILNNIFENSYGSTSVNIPSSNKWKNNSMIIDGNIGNAQVYFPSNNVYCPIFIRNNNIDKIKVQPGYYYSIDTSNIHMVNNNVKVCSIAKNAININITGTLDGSLIPEFKDCKFDRYSTSNPIISNTNFENTVFNGRYNGKGEGNIMTILNNNRFKKCTFVDIILKSAVSDDEFTVFEDCVFYNLSFHLSLTGSRFIFKNCKIVYDGYFNESVTIGSATTYSIIKSAVNYVFIFDRCIFDLSNLDETLSLNINIREYVDPKLESLIYFNQCGFINGKEFEILGTNTYNKYATNEDFAAKLPVQPIYIFDKYKTQLHNYYKEIYWDDINKRYVKLKSSEYISDKEKRVNTYDTVEKVLRTGIFSEKPLSEDGISEGFAYFCTDKQTNEGSTNGIMIYHKGNDVWVDALGRVVE